MKKVKDYMKKAVVYFSPDDTIFHVAKILSENEISGAPVLKDRKLVGIISETDIIKFLSKKILPNPKPSSSSSIILLELLKSEIHFYKNLRELFKTKISNLMKKKVITVKPEDSILKAAEKISKYDIRRLPVIDNNGNLIGIISRTDILRAFSEI